MNGDRYRAWRFVHPDLVAAEGTPSAGLQLTSAGGIDMVAGDASIRQAIQQLLSTTPGERVMRPTFGCHLRRLVFSPNDDTTAGLAIHYVRSALETWEPRIEIRTLDARRQPEAPEILEIMLEYRVRATNRQERLLHQLSLTGEAV